LRFSALAQKALRARYYGRLKTFDSATAGWDFCSPDKMKHKLVSLNGRIGVSDFAALYPGYALAICVGNRRQFGGLRLPETERAEARA
jgi:hypothetical protein